MTEYTRYIKNGLELYVDLEAGEVFATVSGYARMFGIPPDTITSRSRREGRKFEKGRIPTGNRGKQEASLIPRDILLTWMCDDYFKAPTAERLEVIRQFHLVLAIGTDYLLNTSITKALKVKAGDRLMLERRIQLVYQLRYGGAIEVPTVNGRIDLLTDSTIYEIKQFSYWKACLGQLLAYSDCLPDRKLCAVFFAIPAKLEFDGESCSRIEKLFDKHGIRVEYVR